MHHTSISLKFYYIPFYFEWEGSWVKITNENKERNNWWNFKLSKVNEINQKLFMNWTVGNHYQSPLSCVTP